MNEFDKLVTACGQWFYGLTRYTRRMSTYYAAESCILPNGAHYIHQASTPTKAVKLLLRSIKYELKRGDK